LGNSGSFGGKTVKEKVRAEGGCLLKETCRCDDVADKKMKKKGASRGKRGRDMGKTPSYVRNEASFLRGTRIHTGPRQRASSEKGDSEEEC